MSALERIANRGLREMAQAALRSAQSRWLRGNGQRYITRPIHDYHMILDLDDPGISRALNLFGTREGDMKALLEQYIRPGMTVFDIGANIGYYSVMMLQLGANVVCIEPVADNVKLLKRNLRLNDYDHIKVVQCAVSNTEGEQTFFCSEYSNLGTFHPVVGVSKANGDTFKVKTVPLKALVDKYGPPDLIRMDVEGHEIEILNGAVELYNTTFVFETHPDCYTPEHNPANILSLMFLGGFHVAAISSAHPEGTKRIIELGYKPGECIPTDATYRTLFHNISDKDAIELICNTRDVRTVVLTHW